MNNASTFEASYYEFLEPPVVVHLDILDCVRRVGLIVRADEDSATRAEEISIAFDLG